MKDLTLVKGVGQITATKLAEHQIATLKGLVNAPLERIVSATGFGPQRAAAIQASAVELLAGVKPSESKANLPAITEETVRAATGKTAVDREPLKRPAVSAEEVKEKKQKKKKKKKKEKDKKKGKAKEKRQKRAKKKKAEKGKKKKGQKGKGKKK